MAKKKSYAEWLVARLYSVSSAENTATLCYEAATFIERSLGLPSLTTPPKQDTSSVRWVKLNPVQAKYVAGYLRLSAEQIYRLEKSIQDAEILDALHEAR